jgi:hypothetical protein
LQAIPHVPPAHTAVPLGGAGQALLQAPQFCVSIETLRHWLWQGRKPWSQAKPQLPPAQVALPCAGTPQPAPQVEQSLGSEVRSVHLPEQLVWPVGHEVVHRPAAHTWLAPHAAAQAPQFCGSDPRSTQLWPQAT